jgi:histidinol-phosphate aminotransferase
MNNQVLENIIKLSQNENALGPSPKALEAVLNDAHTMHRYPEPHSHSLEKKLAERLNLVPENVFVSAGLVEALDIIIRNFVGKGNNLILGDITFVAYRLLAEVFKVETRFSKMRDYRTDVNDIMSRYDENTKLIIIANPNNPTGTTISESELVRLLEHVSSETLVVVDEAYQEYVSQRDFPDSLSLQKHYQNLVIMRTFSKIYGLAGLRVGYTIANSPLVKKMGYYQAPFTVNRLAAIAAFHAIDDVDFVAQSAEMNKEQRQLLYDELKNNGYNTLPSQGNFQYVYFDTNEERNHFYSALCSRNVFGREMDLFGDNKAIRLSIGTPEDNLKLIESLEQIKFT